MALSPLQLVIKAEYLLQSLVRYPRMVACPHCGGRRHALIARKYAIARIVRCGACGLAFARPIYRSWLAGNFYDRMYSAEGSTTALPDDATLERLKATNFVGTDKDARRVIESLRRALPDRSASLLEIGSSWGYFLHQARASGFDVTGIEIGDTRREFGREKLDLDIVSGFDALPAGRRFDVIYTSHVLEHFTDLTTVFDQIPERLADNGSLFIEVPNFDPDHLGPACLSTVGAVHPIGYDSKWFRENLPRHGLVVEAIHGDWKDVPDRPVGRSATGTIIVQARRR
jgi:SAM-dependent methyltransferase